MFEQGGIIDGVGNLIIQKETIDTNNLTNTSVGLQIGDDSDSISNVPVARTYLRNISISGFNTGLQISSRNFYIFTFENLIFGHNTTDVVYGDGTNSNSGEKITFTNCLFAQAYHGIDIKSRGIFYFINCSFDYVANAIILNQTQRTVLNFVGGHFEKFGNVGIGVNATEENTVGFGSIIYCNFAETWGRVIANFDGSNFYLISSNLSYPLFKTNVAFTQENSAYLDVYLRGCSYGANYPSLLTDDLFISEGQVKINADWVSDTSCNFMFNKYDSVGNLSLVDNSWQDNSKDTDGNNLDLNNLGISVNCNNQGNGVNWSVDTTNKVFDKSIKFSITKDSYPQIIYIVPAHKNKVLSTTFFKLNELESFTSTAIEHFEIGCRYRFFTKNGAVIKSISLNDPTKLIEENGYFRIVPSLGVIPIGTDFIEITYTVYSKDSSNNILPVKGTCYYCGSIVNYVD